jgi:hypothetical protein
MSLSWVRGGCVVAVMGAAPRVAAGAEATEDGVAAVVSLRADDRSELLATAEAPGVGDGTTSDEVGLGAPVAATSLITMSLRTDFGSPAIAIPAISATSPTLAATVTARTSVNGFDVTAVG